MATLSNINIQLRNDSSENWTSKNPVLKNGELIIVMDTENDYRIKVGNGISAYNQLPFLNEKRVSTNIINTQKITTRSFTQGYNTNSIDTSFATGIFTEASANFSVVHGIEATVSDDYSFVFNGRNLAEIDQRYTSHGEGSFNINTPDGLSGVYIGEQTLADIIHEHESQTVSELSSVISAMQDKISALESITASILSKLSS